MHVYIAQKRTLLLKSKKYQLYLSSGHWLLQLGALSDVCGREVEGWRESGLGDGERKERKRKRSLWDLEVGEGE